MGWCQQHPPYLKFKVLYLSRGISNQKAMWNQLYWKSWQCSQAAIKDFFISKHTLNVVMNSVGLHKPVSQGQGTACYLNRQFFQEAVAHSLTICHSQQCLIFSFGTLMLCSFTSTVSQSKRTHGLSIMICCIPLCYTVHRSKNRLLMEAGQHKD